LASDNFKKKLNLLVLLAFRAAQLVIIPSQYAPPAVPCLEANIRPDSGQFVFPVVLVLRECRFLAHSVAFRHSFHHRRVTTDDLECKTSRFLRRS
jgi:hypothetical protein